jgi:hypothetical protein
MKSSELHRRLDGYADYAQRVRYRLVPWVGNRSRGVAPESLL